MVTLGLPVLDEVLQQAQLPSGGAYTSIGTYDWRELAQLATLLAAQTGTTVPELLRGYGRHLFAVFAREYPQLLDRYSELYKRDYAPAAYCAEVRKVIAAGRTKHAPGFRDIRTARRGRSGATS